MGDQSLIPGSGRSLGEGNGCPLQYSCLENPTDRGALQAIVHVVATTLIIISNVNCLNVPIKQDIQSHVSDPQIIFLKYQTDKIINIIFLFIYYKISNLLILFFIQICNLNKVNNYRVISTKKQTVWSRANREDLT